MSRADAAGVAVIVRSEAVSAADTLTYTKSQNP
jgi:hypothetical protein